MIHFFDINNCEYCKYYGGCKYCYHFCSCKVFKFLKSNYCRCDTCRNYKNSSQYYENKYGYYYWHNEQYIRDRYGYDYWYRYYYLPRQSSERSEFKTENNYINSPKNETKYRC